MLRSLPATLLAIALTLTGAAADEPCYTTSAPELDTRVEAGVSLSGQGDGRYYVDNDMIQPFICDCIGVSLWPYEETNGHDGLQRDDEVHSDVSECTDGTEGDTSLLG